MDHAVMAWTYVRSTPVWDNAPHNNARRQCFKALAANALQAIKKGVWTAETAADVKDRLVTTLTVNFRPGFFLIRLSEPVL